MDITKLFPPMAAFVLSPLLLGVINRTKGAVWRTHGATPVAAVLRPLAAVEQGRRLQPHDHLGFCAGPTIALAALVVATLLMPLGSCPAVLGFRGDLILFVYVLALARLSIVLAALDVGSSFEGMVRAAKCCSRPWPSRHCF